MNREFEYKSVSKTTYYKIGIDSLEIKEKSKSNFSEYSIPYEIIGKVFLTNKGFNEEFKEVSIISFFACLILTFILLADENFEYESAILLLPYLTFVVFTILTFTSKSYRKHIELYAANPNILIVKGEIKKQKELDTFIDNLMITKKSFLREKYMDFDFGLSTEENLQRLRMLFENEIISQEEYDEFKMKIKLSL